MRKLKREEAEMCEMTREVEAIHLAKNHFLSNICSSIARPLDKVVESSLLLSSKDELDEAQRNELSDSISKTSAQLMRLINDILDLSRLEAGMMKFMPGNAVRATVEPDAASGEVSVTVYNTALAKRELSQELIILNEVNRMIVTHFGELYEIRPNEAVSYVYLTFRGRVTPIVV